MKNLHRPIPKSKILEELKKTNENRGNQSATASRTTSLLSSSSMISQSMVQNGTPNNLQRSLAQRKATTTIDGATIKIGSNRKSLNKKPALNDQKPKNTIRSMFAKQLEMSQREKSQINGAIDQITTLNINDNKESENKEQHATGNDASHNDDDKTAATVTQTANTNGEEILVNGSLHKRLTRRNSMTLRTPTKSTPTAAAKSDDIVPTTPSSIKKRRCTMFTPSLKASIEEDIFDASISENNVTASTQSTDSTVTSSNKTVLVTDKTLNKSTSMDVCNQSRPRNTMSISQSNSKVRQLLNDDLSKNSCEASSITEASSSSSMSGIEGNKFLQPKIRLPLHTRRTTFTAQPMDETKVLHCNDNNSSTSSTPVSLTKRRVTMNINGRADVDVGVGLGTPHSKVVRNLPELNKSNSCDAILTPTNKITGEFFHLHNDTCSNLIAENFPYFLQFRYFNFR